MPCFVPFDGKDLDVVFFAFRPVGVFADELIHGLKLFSFFTTDNLGCAYSSVFKSIHGYMIIWYGAWIKMSSEDRKTLSATLISALANVSHLAILLEYGFFEPYVGESRDGRHIAKFSTGDTISISAMVPISGDTADLSYACMALLKSYYLKTDGITAGVCLDCLDKPMVASFHVWRSLHACYTWLLNSDYRNNVRPYTRHLSDDSLHDVFKVVYVSCDDMLSIALFAPVKMIGYGTAMITDGSDEDERQQQEEVKHG